MNQPTREEFERLEEEQRQIKEEVRKLREQITEPIKITRLEIDQGGMNKRLDAVQEDTAILKEEMKGARADIASLKAIQSDHSAFFIEHGQHLKEIETKQDAHTEVLGKLVNFAESHDTMLKTVATKEDLTSLEARIEARFDRLEAEILRRLPRPEGE